ncbi:tight adherence protein C [Streptacidiphilus sp. MAP12-16]|uniref:type II secretion system F family protein n=1 Tax=Streptacidiphilus sp. MAP12-16 TaxID=3156300 RepID=UPI003511F8E2
MIVNLLLGSGAGLGLFGLLYVLRPAQRPALGDALAHLHAPAAVHLPPPAPVAAAGQDGWSVRTGLLLAPALRELGLPGTSQAADLACLDADPQRHLAEKATGALAGLLLPYVGYGLLVLLGAHGSWATWGWASLVLAAAGFFAPDFSLRSRAEARRAETRYALSLFLEMTAIALSGGAGVHQALSQAAACGQGAAFADFRNVLAEAAITRTPPWGPLGRLGHKLGVSELEELACTIQLAGSEGAKVRASLIAKAESLRVHLLAADEAHAGTATERMSLPVVLLLSGFLLFIGYPAVINAFHGL